MDDEGSSLPPLTPLKELRSSSMRAILSGVKSFQNGGGLGNVEDREYGSWSAMFNVLGRVAAGCELSWRRQA